VPTWGELLKELNQLQVQLASGPPPAPGTPSPHDVLRRRYLRRLHEATGRAIITYYSGWLEHPEAPPRMLSVGPSDIAGFMEACSNAQERELDLFLHSPGGDPEAAEQICGYLRTQFDHIRVIVPVYAMSAATMIALSADRIIMGAHSQLGPIDPQFTINTPEGPRSASAQAIKDQFAMAIEQCKDPNNLPAWMPILRSYSPGLLAACDHAAKRAREIVAKAMEGYMLAGEDDPGKAAAEAAEWFGNAAEFLSHGRPVRRKEAREHRVLIDDLEALEGDVDFQDLMLSVHHATMLTFSQTPTAKLIENHHGRAWIQMQQQLQLALPAGPGGPIVPGPLMPAVSPPTAKKPPPQPPRKRGKRR
jgi:Serine dehydrogenase proteinase